MFLFANKKNYSKLSDKELLTNFRSENWAKLNSTDRIKVLQEVENRNAAEQGREPCLVKSVAGKEQYGCYYPTSNKIEVNVENSIKNKDGSITQNNSYQVLDTIYHEGEHAHQTNCVKNNIEPPQGLPKTTRDMCEIENSGNNYQGVISYSNCTCEIDSNNVAAKKVLESKELFKDDVEFNNYIDDRCEYFERVKNKDMSQVHMQQNEAVYRAYSRGDIDMKKHDDILLNEVYKDQPAFEEAKLMSERMNNEKMEYSKDIQNDNDVNAPCYSRSIEDTQQVEPTVQSSYETTDQGSDYDDSIDIEEEEQQIKRR